MTMQLSPALYSDLLTQARQHARLRVAQLLHQNHAEPVQRMVIAMQAQSYVRPHRHPLAQQWELVVVLQGELDVLWFAESGAVLERFRLTTGQGLQTPAGMWHSIVVPHDAAVFLEVKEGPFVSASAAEFALFAPEEGAVEVPHYLQSLRTASGL